MFHFVPQLVANFVGSTFSLEQLDYLTKDWRFIRIRCWEGCIQWVFRTYFLKSHWNTEVWNRNAKIMIKKMLSGWGHPCCWDKHDLTRLLCHSLTDKCFHIFKNPKILSKIIPYPAWKSNISLPHVQESVISQKVHEDLRLPPTTGLLPLPTLWGCPPPLSLSPPSVSGSNHLRLHTTSNHEILN